MMSHTADNSTALPEKPYQDGFFREGDPMTVHPFKLLRRIA